MTPRSPQPQTTGPPLHEGTARHFRFKDDDEDETTGGRIRQQPKTGGVKPAMGRTTQEDACMTLNSHRGRHPT